MVPEFQSHPPFAIEINAPIYVNDHAYVPEPHMNDGRRYLWYHVSLIPYTLVGYVHAFMGPLPMRIQKPHMLKEFFHYFLGYEPLVFVDALFNFNFFKNKVFHYSPPT